ncbi:MULTISPECIES: hypothetical protein [unclassified Stygiolobus]|uniref:hypothetical protein n=1 Tax=unclassified Stygiolobus TaxID=2824672 RepID=UPI00307F8565
MNGVQFEAIIWSLITFILSLGLTFLVWSKYDRSKSKMWLFWFLGFVLFSVGTLCQVLFAFGISNYPLSAIYVFAVAELVLILSLGSIQQIPQKFVKLYYVYSVVASIIIVIAILAQSFNVVEDYLPMNYPPLVVSASSVATIPGTGVILFLAARAILFKANPLKMGMVILGIVILAFGGMLAASGFYIALYISEIMGMSLFLYGIY